MPGNSTYIFRHTLLATLGAVTALSGPALSVQAHFTLLEPESWIDENALGDPQKNGPCGGESGMPTGAVTTYQAGKLVVLRNDNGVLNTHFRNFMKPMGLAVEGGKLAIG